jgi:DNA integrity scanning protein DisA with diadenylate cyclase activity
MQGLIARELVLHGIHLDETSWLASRAVLEELTHVLTPELHEGSYSPFGVIFTDSVDSLGVLRKLPLEPHQLALGRLLADGVNSFLLYEKAVPTGLVLFAEPRHTEIQLVRTVPPTGGMVVQRSAAGLTKFVRNQGIISHLNRSWFNKPHVEEATDRIVHSIPDIDRTVLSRILEFAFHLLSPGSRTGAILVWHLTPDNMNDYSSAFSGDAIRNLNLSVLNKQDSNAICHLLSQIDGATILSPNGTLLQTGVQLKPTAEAVRLVPEFKGTRHSSSLRYSYDHRNVLVITVSEDGPIAIFSDGTRIAGLRTQSAEQETQLLKSLVPETSLGVTTQSIHLACKRCHKTALVEVISMPNVKTEHTAVCPVCNAKLYTAKCLKMHCRLFKRVADLGATPEPATAPQDSTPVLGSILARPAPIRSPRGPEIRP